MLALPFASMIDEWQEKLALEVMPDMTMPVPGYVAYGLMAIGGIFLLVGLWRLVTLRIFRGFFAVVAALLVAYYPVAYGVHWWLYKYNAEVKQEQGYSELEKTMIKNLKYVDWGVMGGGVFFGILLFYLTTGGGKSGYEDEEDDYGAPQVPQARTGSSRRAPPKPAKDPFDFT